MLNSEKARFVVVGGGIAGVSCAQQLSESAPQSLVTVVTASPLIKAVTNVRQLSRAVTDFDVEEQDAATLSQTHPNATVVHASVLAFERDNQTVALSNGSAVEYDRLCICTGATPKLISGANKYVIGIRDTGSVEQLQHALQGARRVVIVGNGGIATELVYAIEGCDVVWAIKDKSIGTTFFDSGASHFFLPSLTEDGSKAAKAEKGAVGDNQSDCQVFHASKRMKYRLEEAPSDAAAATSSSVLGSALGPDWCEGDNFHKPAGKRKKKGTVSVVYTCEVGEIGDPCDALYQSEHTNCRTSSTEKVDDWPVFVRLTNGRVYGCDFIVSATGVVPQTTPFTDCAEFVLSDDGGLCVDCNMRTSVAHVYAAGDVCSATWETSPHWHQMKLWTQARQMGAYAALCMAEESGERSYMDFCFELFAHVTKFFGYKVVLLGLFNSQRLPDNHELLIRCTEGVEYIKVVLHDGRMQGAVLIGDTDLEETFENLILNRTDLSRFGESLLDPGVDLEDYFD